MSQIPSKDKIRADAQLVADAVDALTLNQVLSRFELPVQVQKAVEPFVAKYGEGSFYDFMVMASRGDDESNNVMDWLFEDGIKPFNIFSTTNTLMETHWE